MNGRVIRPGGTNILLGDLTSLYLRIQTSAHITLSVPGSFVVEFFLRLPSAIELLRVLFSEPPQVLLLA